MTGNEGNANTGALSDAIAALFNAPAQMAAALAGGIAQRASPGCEIPAPCWEPRPAGTCALQLAPGGTGKVRIHVSNCDWSRRVVMITALGKIAAWLQFDPTTLVVDPQSRETLIVTVRVPAGIKPGQRISGPALIRGCVDHFVRLDITVAECAGRTCCDVQVEDCPDHIHHWYDHFYCPRPCRNLTTRGVKDG